MKQELDQTTIRMYISLNFVTVLQLLQAVTSTASSLGYALHNGPLICPETHATLTPATELDLYDKQSFIQSYYSMPKYQM
jgi:hypothetical protein